MDVSVGVTNGIITALSMSMADAADGSGIGEMFLSTPGQNIRVVSEDDAKKQQQTSVIQS